MNNGKLFVEICDLKRIYSVAQLSYRTNVYKAKDRI